MWAAGGQVAMAFKSGFTNGHSTVRDTMAPGPLRAAAGFHYQEFTNLAAVVKLNAQPVRRRRSKPWLGVGGVSAAGHGRGGGVARPSL